MHDEIFPEDLHTEVILASQNKSFHLQNASYISFFNK